MAPSVAHTSKVYDRGSPLSEASDAAQHRRENHHCRPKLLRPAEREPALHFDLPAVPEKLVFVVDAERIEVFYANFANA
jgi:hypothetical protein